MIDWGLATKEDFEKAALVLDRYEEKAPPSARWDRVSMLMDLIACHTHGCPLDWDAMLSCDMLNLSHDVCGINRHIDRETGELRDCFVPRMAKRV